jgi:hypothetical protein
VSEDEKTSDYFKGIQSFISRAASDNTIKKGKKVQTEDARSFERMED